jgi:hypothetical protein
MSDDSCLQLRLLNAFGHFIDFAFFVYNDNHGAILSTIIAALYRYV